MTQTQIQTDNSKAHETMAKLKAFAEKNYSKGYDTFVECYEDYQWLEMIADHRNKIGEIKATMKSVAAINREERTNAEIEGFDPFW